MKDRTLFFLIIVCSSISIILFSIFLHLLLKLLKKKDFYEDYDTYILSIFWPSTLCSKKSEGNDECFQLIKNKNISNYFTLHGLWPSKTENILSKSAPPECNNKEYIVPNFEKDKAFKERLDNLWPGLIVNNTNLWTHEYNKHGICYMRRNYRNLYDYKIYFDKSVNMLEKDYRNMMERVLPDSKGVYNVSLKKFRNILNSKLRISNSHYEMKCDNETGLLSEIRFFYYLNFTRRKIYNITKSCPRFFLLNFTDDTKKDVFNKYDYYIYSLSYGPTFCKKKQYPEDCYKKLKSKNNNRFIIHGLWPSYKNNIIPRECNIGEDIQIKSDKANEFLKNISEYWYSLNPSDEKFWTHEYNVHGLCYVKRFQKNEYNYKFYFEKVMEIYNNNNFINLYNNIYQGFLPRIQKVNKTYLIEKLNQLNFPNSSYILLCSKIANELYLDEIKFKLGLDFKPITDANSTETCPEEFMIEILDGPKKTYDDDLRILNNYEVYTYSIFFQSSTCKTVGYHCYNAIKNFPRNMWTIHGLWPNYKNVTDIPDWCHGKNDIEIELENQTLYNYMKTYWPGLFSTNERFWGYEYNKHGFCYNKRNNINVLEYEKYFLKTISIYEKYDLKNIFINMFDKKLEKGDKKLTEKQFEKYFEKVGIKKGSFFLICNIANINNQKVPYISEIRIRFDLDFNIYIDDKNKDKIKDICPDEFFVEFL